MTELLTSISRWMRLLLSLILIISITPSTAIASPDIAIRPPNPTENDIIVVTVSGEWGSSCVPRYVSHHRIGNTIRIESRAAPPPDVYCLLVITEWGFAVHIGALPPGEYIVRVEIDGELYDTATFEVTSTAPTPTPMPTNTLIPTETPTPTATSTVTPTFTPEPECVVRATLLEVRSGPGVEYHVIAHVNRGNKLRPIARSPEGVWIQVLFQRIRPGWVSGNPVDCNVDVTLLPVGRVPPTPTPPPPPSPTASATSSPSATTVTTAPSLSPAGTDVVTETGGPAPLAPASRRPGSEQAGRRGLPFLLLGLVLLSSLAVSAVVIASRRLLSRPTRSRHPGPTVQQPLKRQPGVLPSRLGPYRLIERIGHGGWAWVYKAHQPSLKRYVALKILDPQLTWDAQSVQRFRQEATTAAALDHPNIVPIYDVGEQDGLHYIAMKYIAGGSLKDLLAQERPMDLERILRITHQVAEALEYAHRRGVIHRDIKPGNILVGPDDHVTLTDFGIAKILAGGTLTVTGRVVGTPEYMSPEQAKGERVDHRTDIYSLGIVIYEMLTGRVPFRGDNPLVIMHQQVHRDPPRPRQINPSIPQDVEAVILRALAKAPGRRFSSALEMIRALISGAGGGHL